MAHDSYRLKQEFLYDTYVKNDDNDLAHISGCNCSKQEQG